VQLFPYEGKLPPACRLVRRGPGRRYALEAEPGRVEEIIERARAAGIAGTGWSPASAGNGPSRSRMSPALALDEAAIGNTRAGCRGYMGE